MCARCNRQTYSPMRQYTDGYKSATKIVAFYYPEYILTMENMARIYVGIMCIMHDVKAKLKPIWMQNVSVISTKPIVIVLQINPLNTSTLKKFTFTLNTYSLHKLKKYELPRYVFVPNKEDKA